MDIYNIAQFFYSIVEKFENNKAIIFIDNQFITYTELNKLSNQIARLFLEKGVRTNDVVCIFNDKTKYGFASMLACLKIGAIYANLDPDNPNARLKRILDICEPKVVVSDITEDQKISKLSKEERYDYIKIKRNANIAKINGYRAENIEESESITGANPAYIMFTSGSTGFPKGVLISHDNLLSFIKWSRNRFSVDENDILTNLNPIYFDNSVFDFYTALFSGASIAAIPKSIMNDHDRIVKCVDQIGCTVWFSVPSLLIYLMTMKTLNRNVLRNVRIFAFGGEGYPKKELKKLYDLYRDSSELINVYGPTECTCICSAYTIGEDEFSDFNELPLLGPINSNIGYTVLDEKKAQISKGGVGELCLLGPNVGIGYYNNKEKTESAFIRNPHNLKFYEKMYKTGDLVCEKQVNGNTCLAFKGRKDNQIKHFGYRIELEEIETAINRNERVTQSVAVYHKINDKFGDIVAFIAVLDGLSTEEIKKQLKKELPEYMLPTKYVMLNQLPKNQNGKVDRSSLKSTLALDQSLI
jgi:D-alanine--poly(phosphoribitol) ligase subunit 1